jgi:hypothetical protein
MPLQMCSRFDGKSDSAGIELSKKSVEGCNYILPEQNSFVVMLFVAASLYESDSEQDHIWDNIMNEFQTVFHTLANTKLFPIKQPRKHKCLIFISQHWSVLLRD